MTNRWETLNSYISINILVGYTIDIHGYPIDMRSIRTVISETKFKDRPKNISHEFQFYGCYMAETLGDTKHYSLYIKLAKEQPRSLLEEALNFTKGYYNAKNKAKVFMWRLAQLRATQGP